MELLKLILECDFSGHPYNWYIEGESKAYTTPQLGEHLRELGYSEEEIDKMFEEAEEIY